MASRALTILAYVLVAAAAVALEAAARQRRAGLVPIGRLLGPLRALPVARLCMLLGWAWLCWHLLAR